MISALGKRRPAVLSHDLENLHKDQCSNRRKPEEEIQNSEATKLAPILRGEGSSSTM